MENDVHPQAVLKIRITIIMVCPNYFVLITKRMGCPTLMERGVPMKIATVIHHLIMLE
jgi:hypothetical protein